MKPWKLLCSLAGLGTLFALTAHAATVPCPVSCGSENTACLKAARMTRSTCRMDCRTNSANIDLGPCIAGCASTFRSSVTECRTDEASCVHACSPPSSSSGDPSTANCLGICGENLGSCARGVTSDAKTCISGCRTASDRLSCLQGCASAGQSAAEACASDFQSCTSDCGSTTTTTLASPPCTSDCGSTTTTTLPTQSGCGQRDDGTCGGMCPTRGDVCQDVSGTCTCVTPR